MNHVSHSFLACPEYGPWRSNLYFCNSVVLWAALRPDPTPNPTAAEKRIKLDRAKLEDALRSKLSLFFKEVRVRVRVRVRKLSLFFKEAG